MRRAARSPIVLEGVGKSFVGREGGRVARWRRSSLAVAGGDDLLPTGPTGCGKSTILRLAAGLEAAGPGAGRACGAAAAARRDAGRLC